MFLSNSSSASFASGVDFGAPGNTIKIIDMLSRDPCIKKKISNLSHFNFDPHSLCASTYQ